MCRVYRQSVIADKRLHDGLVRAGRRRERCRSAILWLDRIAQLDLYEKPTVPRWLSEAASFGSSMPDSSIGYNCILQTQCPERLSRSRTAPTETPSTSSATVLWTENGVCGNNAGAVPVRVGRIAFRISLG